jgi:hypothetical protein
MSGLGYGQSYYDSESKSLVVANTIDITRAEEFHYELYPFRRLEPILLDELERSWLLKLGHGPVRIDHAGRAFIIIEVDIHHGVAVDIDSALLWSRAVDSMIGEALTFSDCDHLWLITARYYHEVALHGKRSLRDFAYIAALLKTENIDWDQLLITASELEIRPALFYYLSFAEKLLESPVLPPEALSSLDPRAGSRLRDWGWQLAVLFDEIEPCPSWAMAGET